MTLSAYVRRELLLSIFFCGIVVLTISSFFTFLGEQKKIQEGGYELVHVIWYVLLSMPEKLYEVMPFVCLIGSVLKFSMLAERSEFVCMRLYGFSRWPQFWVMLQVSLIVILLQILLSEVVIPWSSQRSKSIQPVQEAQSLPSKQLFQGGWFREGNVLVRFGGLEAEHRGYDVTVIQEAIPGKQLEVWRAKQAIFLEDKGGWQLQAVKVIHFNQKTIQQEDKAVVFLALNLAPSSLKTLLSDQHGFLSFWQSFQFGIYDRGGVQNSDAYIVILWDRVVILCSTFFVISFSFPFAFLQHRSKNINDKMALGILVGVTLIFSIRIVGGWLQGQGSSPGWVLLPMGGLSLLSLWLAWYKKLLFTSLKLRQT